MRSYEQQKDQQDFDIPNTHLRLARARASKIQNHSVVLWPGGDQSMPWYTELMPMAKKDQKTIASSIIAVLTDVWSSLGLLDVRGASSNEMAQAIRLIHLITGDAGSIFQEDPNWPSVHYWVWTFVRYLKAHMDKGATVESLENFRVYPKYVANMLLDCALTKEQLQSFASAFSELRKTCQSLFPVRGLADAFVSMAEFDPTEDKPLDIDFLNMASRTKLVQSTLYKSFVQAAQVLKVASLKKDTKKSSSERLRAVEKILSVEPENEELQFAKTLFSTLGRSELLNFLGGDAEKHFAWLEDRQYEWWPGHEALMARNFVSEKVVWKDVPMQDILKGLDYLVANEDCTPLLPSGLGKSLAKDCLALKKVSESTCLASFTSMFLIEMISFKTGALKDIPDKKEMPAAEDVLAATNVEFAKVCAKVANAKVPRANNPAHKVADEIVLRHLPTETIEKPPSAEKKPSEQKQPAESMPSKEDPLAPVDANGVALMKGDTVRTIAHKRKDQYDQKEAKVLALNSKKAKVELPCGEKRDYEYKNLKFLKRLDGSTEGVPRQPDQNKTPDLNEMLQQQNLVD
eukprot:Skav225795  [mRNA]  locus=scaffold396:88026:89950:+ [translate_table: standard]